MRDQRDQFRGLTEMGKGLLGGACLEWGLSGWAGQPYGETGERQAGVFKSAWRRRRGGKGRKGKEGRGEEEEPPPGTFSFIQTCVVFFGGSVGGRRPSGAAAAAVRG